MFSLQHIPPDYQGDYSFKSHRDLTLKKVQVSVSRISLALFGLYILVSFTYSINFHIEVRAFIIISIIWVFIFIIIMHVFHKLSQIDRYLLKKNTTAKFFPDYHISSQEFIGSGLFKTADLNVKGDHLMIDNELKICHLGVKQLNSKLAYTQTLFDGVFITKKLKQSSACYLMGKQKDGVKDHKLPKFLMQLTNDDHQFDKDKVQTSSVLFNSSFDVYSKHAKKAEYILTKSRMQLIGSIHEQLNTLMPRPRRSKNNSPFQILFSFKKDQFYMAIKNLQMKPPLFFKGRKQHFNALSNIIEIISKI